MNKMPPTTATIGSGELPSMLPTNEKQQQQNVSCKQNLELWYEE